MGRAGGFRGGGRRYGGGAHHRYGVGMRTRHLHRRVATGFHRVGWRSRCAHRYRRHGTLYRTYFGGRRLRYHWGRRHGAIYPVPFYNTPTFLSTQTTNRPTVNPRNLTITLQPYTATQVTVPAGVQPGGVFQFGTYLIACPVGAMPGSVVELMLPPQGIPATADRSDVLCSLGGPNSNGATAQPTLGADGVPAPTPFTPGQDAYITVLAVSGQPDSLQVHVPATAALTLKHVVDAVDSWGEVALETRTENTPNVVQTDFQVDMVQIGVGGPRWEHEQFVDTAVPLAPRVVSVVVPEGAVDMFVVGPDITGCKEPIHVKVLPGTKPGDAVEVVIPSESVAAPVATNAEPNPNAWAAPPGFDFYSTAQQHQFILTMGVLEVTVTSHTTVDTGSAADYTRAVCCRKVFIIVALILIMVGIGLGVGLTNDDPEWCSEYYGYNTLCKECPTQPLDSSLRICWEDASVTWNSMTSYQQTAWADLGYFQSTWDAGDTSYIADYCWYDLSSAERSAAIDLGYNQNLWEYPDRC